MSLEGKSFLKLLDLSQDEIQNLLILSEILKQKKINNEKHDILKGKNIALIFEKTSTRTRCSFEIAAHDLGMNVTYLDSSNSQIGKKESIKDTARVLGKMFDGIEYRGYEQKKVEELALYSNIPVWNGLTNEYHPTQILADLLTIKEHFKKLKGINLVYMGDARFNMGNSLMVGCAKMGLNFTACSPCGYFPNQNLQNKCFEIAKNSGSKLMFESNIKKAVAAADVIYTDIWVSMGESEEVWNKRINDLLPYKVDKKLMEMAKKETIFMHCLPSYHNKDTVIGKTICEKYGLNELEVTDEVFESNSSLVFEEAENRLHTIKAVMLASFKGEKVFL